MSKIKKGKDDSNTNGSLSSSKKSTTKENLLNHSGTGEKKNSLANQGVHSKASRTRIKDSFRESFNAKFGKKIEIKETDELGSSGSGSSSGPNTGSSGVTFADKPNTKRLPAKREGSGLMILSPDRRRASRGPAINPHELYQMYRSKEATYAQQYVDSSLFPYKWIPPFAKPQTDAEPVTTVLSSDSVAKPSTPTIPPLVSTPSPLRNEESSSSIPTAEKTTISAIVNQARLKRSISSKLPTYDQMFVSLDIKFEGYFAWQTDLHAKIDERKKKAQREKQQLARSSSSSKLTKSASIVALSGQSQTPPQSNTPPTATNTPNPSIPPPLGATQIAPNNGSNSNLTAQLTARKTNPAVAASIASSLGFQKFNELTELERSFTRLKLTINPLWLLRKRLQVSQFLR
eukprot:TRINITY_DN3810_c0_g1_i2.p1 TRINITY_DN3810_c0_g1~~TRINITY_DN3810_c0_g1_i2.p1  ORF type:complete len:403 (-),score=85.65 TRINITY_DN3810_c0_g1_i2:333-1541(-)